MSLKIKLILFILLVCFILLMLIKRFFNAKKEKRILAEDKIREEALDRMILNHATGNDKEQVYVATPVEVSYEQQKKRSGNSKSKKQIKTMVQLEESNELSSRKYVLDPTKKIYLGAKQGANQIIVSGENISDRQCEIQEASGKIYIQNIGNSACVVLKRGSQKAYVEKQYVEIKSGDELLIGKVSFRINLL